MISFIMTALSDSPKVHRHSLALTMWCFYIHNYLCLSKECFLTRCKKPPNDSRKLPTLAESYGNNFFKEVLVPRLSSNALWFDYGATATGTNMVVNVHGTLIRPWIETFPMTVASTRAWRPRAQVSKCGRGWGWCRWWRTPFFMPPNCNHLISVSSFTHRYLIYLRTIPFLATNQPFPARIRNAC